MNSSSSTALVICWLAYLGVVVYLAQLFGAVVIPVAAIMMVPLIVMMNLVTKQEQRSAMGALSGKDSEKRKRKRIDAMVRDMSDEELYELRQRLQDGTFDEDDIYEHVVGDDGELMRR